MVLADVAGGRGASNFGGGGMLKLGVCSAWGRYVPIELDRGRDDVSGVLGTVAEPPTTGGGEEKLAGIGGGGNGGLGGRL